MGLQQWTPTADAVVRGRRRIAQLVNRRMSLPDFFVEADRALRSLVDYDIPCWMSCDPATLLPTSHYSPGSDGVHLLELTRNEYLDDDVNKVTELARAPRPVATLRQATEGHPERSARFVRIFEPMGHGDGDELRALFVMAGTPWGCVILHRAAGVFTDEEVDLIASLGPLFAEGIRRSILADSSLDDAGAPGLIVLTSTDEVEAITPPARLRIAAIIDNGGWPGELPLAVLGLAEQARLVAAGLSTEPATARIPLRDGSWLLAHGVILEGDTDGRVGVTLTPVGQTELSSIIVDAYGLSPREREIARLVLTGLSTDAIAGRLNISPYTVQDHLKSIFDKVGVRSRRELVAEVFFRHYAPRLGATVRSA